MTKEVLLIDDDSDFRASLRYLLRDKPYRFVEAASSAEGIEQLDNHPGISVILLDLSLGKAKGTTVLEHIKRRLGQYRVIVLTGHEELLRAEQAGEYEVFNYLPKAENSSSQAIRFSVDQAFKDLERERLDRKNCFLLEVQKKIANRETKETLDLICQAVRSIVGAYTCHIRVYDFGHGDFHLRGFDAADVTLCKIFKSPRAKGDLFSGKVVGTGKPEVFDDLQSSEKYRRFAEKALQGKKASPEERAYWQSVQSAYIVPISTGLFGKSVDAVLNVSSKSKSFFNEEKCAQVDEFVTQAALTVTKDWLQRKRAEIHDDYRKISRMLADMGDKLRGTNVLKGIYDVVLRRLSEIVNSEVVSIFLYNDATGMIESVAELRGDKAVDAPDEVYEPGQSLTGSVFKEEKTIQLPQPDDPNPVNPLEDPRFDLDNKDRYLGEVPSNYVDHYLGVPIRVGGKVHGVLRAVNKKSKYYDQKAPHLDRSCLLERGFSLDCRNVMEITASHLAVAIRNAELIKEKDYQVEQVRTLGEVGRLINAALNIEDLLKLTIQKMAEVMQAEICMLFLRDEEEDRVALKQSFGMPMLENAFYGLGEGVTGEVAQAGKGQLIRRADNHDGKYDREINAHLKQKYGKPKVIESLMVVPIVAKSSILGVMKVINKEGEGGQYNESDLDLFQAFADYVGVAIENARIYKDQSQLVSAVAHEINNTSGVIPANVAGIKAQLKVPSENIYRMLATIEDSANQATEFANEIAGFAVNRAGEKRARDIGAIIRNAAHAISQGEPQVLMELGDEPIFCDVYERPFGQIVRNIIINAIQALEGQAGGRIFITAKAELGFAVVSFRDNGPGIKPESRSKIFQAEFTTKARGNGLGLWLVRTQIQRIGGRIEVESEPGKGAIFILWIPLSQQAEVPDAAPFSADR